MKLAVRSQVIFDAGANIGLYALLAAKVNPRSSIHAFEPTPSIVARLDENIRLNNLHNIKVNAVAVGAKRLGASCATAAGVTAVTKE